MIARFPTAKAWVTGGLLLWGSLGRVSAASADGSALFEQGNSAFRRGAFSEAASAWQSAAELFRARHDTNSEVRTLVSLAGACQWIGQQRHAVQVLERALDEVEKSGDHSQVTRVKSKLGAALVLTRDFGRATTVLREAEQEAKNSGDTETAAAILNDQGNLLASQQNYAEALTAYTACAAALPSGAILAAQALCNAAAAATRTGEPERADELIGQALRAAEGLEPSHMQAFLLLTIGETEQQHKATENEEVKRRRLRAHQAFEHALRVAEKSSDVRIETYALGDLGRLYEEDGQRDAALMLTRRAIFAAQQAQMPEALYRWQWQLGRILKAQGEIGPAIATYRSAVQTLQPIRNDIALGYGNSAGRSAFREAVGPLFFELADLLLQQVAPETDPAKTQNLLLEARDTVEQLKAVELEDYFRDDCVNVQRTRERAVEAIDEHTAVVYLIPLPNRTELLVGLVSGLKRFTVEVNAEKLTEVSRLFRRNLETRTTYGFLAQGQQLYDWVIRPIQGLLKEHGIDTLVFVPDGALRTIPFACLYDGERYLIQEFAVAAVPGLSLVEPRPIQREKVHLLLNGLSESVQGFPALNFVPGELQGIEPFYHGDTLLNEGFTSKELKRRLTEEQYGIVHIASHGQFDRDVRKTFVLTYDGKLTLNDLEALIRPSKYRGQPVELLVLSACQTAAGDDRAALGLAGIAVKAGVRSALATLWFVNDQSTSALVTELYDQLRHSPGISKARALQAAQIKLLNDRRYRHPCYWAPYLIIGNWL